MSLPVTPSHLCSECSEKLRFPGSSVPAGPIGNEENDNDAQDVDVEEEEEEDNVDEDCRLLGYTMHGQRPDCEYTIIDSYPDLAPLTERSSGCEFCRLLRKSLTSREFRGLAEDHTISHVTTLGLWISLAYTWDFKYTGNENEREVGLWFLTADLYENSQLNGHHLGSISFPLSTASESITNFYGMGSSIYRDPFTERCLSFIRRELDCCSNSCTHPQPSSDFLPTRLIAIVKDSDECKIDSCDIPSLISSKAGRTRYLAVTYCWGDRDEASQQKKLTPANASSFYNPGVSISNLTPIQRETIKLAKALSIPFVCIDALCILQGDIEDWERESAQMGDIYSNAFFTVCSLTSWSCLEGFTPVEKKMPVPVAFRSAFDPDVHGEIAINGNFVVGKDVMDPEWLSRVDISQSQWIRRAWTFQELVLSPRFVHFGESGVGFQCKRNADEDARNNKNNNYNEGLEFWNRTVIPEYSKRKISYASDILPALSGLAKRASKTIQSRYLAGIWKRDLPYALMWTKDRPEASSMPEHLQAVETQADFVVPSWSWAGCGRVGWGVGDFLMFDNNHLYYKDMCTSPVHADTLQKGLDPFEAIKSGSLSLEAIVYPLSDGYHLPSGFYGFHHGMFYLEREGVSPLINFNLDWMPDDNDKDLGKLMLVLLGTATPIEDTPHLRRGRYRSLLEKPFGLLVHPSTKEKGKYVRAGTWSAKSFHKEDGFLPLEMKFFEGLERRVIDLL